MGRAKLELAGHLAKQSMTSEQLATVKTTDHTSLRRVRRALVAGEIYLGTRRGRPTPIALVQDGSTEAREGPRPRARFALLAAEPPSRPRAWPPVRSRESREGPH
jgi:hypothetical protein